MESKLTFIKDLGIRNKRRFGLWKCECGNGVEIRSDNVKNRYACKECSKIVKGSKIREQKTLNDINPGQRFGLLTVISEGLPRTYKNGKSLKTANCKCDCGVFKEVVFTHIKNGNTRSCGCKQNEKGRKHPSRCGISPTNKTHGDSVKTSSHYYLHILWMRIVDKTTKSKHIGFKRYGGRGISMFKPWVNDYVQFKRWILNNLGERPEGLTLDRYPNNDGNYEPNNLRWATPIEQANNREREILLNVKGRKRSLSTGSVKKRYEKHYKFKVPKGNQVHHIDWNRDNNNPSNLLDVTTKQHGWLHRMENEHIRYKTREEIIEILKQNNI